MRLTGLRGVEERLIVDTSEGRPVYMLVGEKGSYLRLSKSTYQLLRQVSRGVSFEQLAEAMCQQGGRQVTAAEVEAAYQRVVKRIAEIEERTERSKGGFWFRRRLVPGAVVSRIATVFSVAFRPAVALVLVAAILAAVGLATRFVLNIQPGHFWWSYGLFVASLMAHETGHASACARYGARPGDIGLTTYFIYPSFYCDVSAAWELKRWQRVVVDLGGVYFQLIFGAGCAVAYALTSWEPLGGALVFIAGSCLFSLNPILKFDGYWVVADALGVTNLAQQPSRIMRYLVGRARGQAVRPLPWPPLVSGVLMIYSVVSVCFWVWFLWRLFPVIGRQAVRYADVAAVFGRWLMSMPASLDAALVWDFAASTFMMLFLVVMAGRMLWPTLSAIRARIGGIRRRSTPLEAEP